MAATQKGTVGALRGVKDATLTVKTKAGSGVSSNNVWNVLSSYELSNESKSDEIPGNDAGPLLIAGSDYRKKLRVECIAASGAGGTKADALALFINLPVFLDEVWITATDDTEIAGVTEPTNWIVQSATKRGVRDGFATASFELFRTDSDLDDVT